MKKPKFKTPKPPERLKRIYERWELRSVKYRSLHFARYVAVPTVAVYVCGAAGAGRLTNSLPVWGMMPLYILLLWWSLRAAVALCEKRAYAYKCTDAEIVNTEEQGEALEVGPGWRRFKTTFVLSRGHGKLQRSNMEWIEFALNLETGAVKPLAASNPDAQVAFELHTGREA